MPLGFGKSIFSKSAAAGATASRGAYKTAFGTGRTSAYYQANFLASDLSASTSWTTVMWMRMKSSDFDESAKAFDARPGGGSNSHQLSLWMELDGGTDRFSNNGLLNLSFGGQNPLVDAYPSSPFNTQASAEANVLDGAWHCWMWTWENSTGGSGCQFYFDNNDVTNVSGTFVTTQFPWNNAHSWTLGAWTDGPGSYGADWDIGPIWWYNTKIDLDDSSVRGKFFNASNTDGYVDGGTTGTAGGQPTPTVYLYHNGTTLVDGQSTVSSFTTVGSPSSIADTDGPGSGGTR
jgi:hypothetical protein